jgi:hypothetical protein
MPRNIADVLKSRDFFQRRIMHFFHHRVRDELDLWVLPCAIEHDLRSAEAVLAVNQ